MNRWLKMPNKVLKANCILALAKSILCMSGFRPRTNNAIFQKLLNLAEQYKVPMIIHIDSGGEQAFIKLCSDNPNFKMIFAHAGGNLRPGHIEKILLKCNNYMTITGLG
jgi:hypothetical protein